MGGTPEKIKGVPLVCLKVMVRREQEGELVAETNLITPVYLVTCRHLGLCSQPVCWGG